jgi:hypothetical protein|tara:strand:- start:2039 stop:2221 length:183 start_codon:yes stop_codon:yes gene_type:complete
MKNLENYGVLEMDAKEIRDIDGGNPYLLGVFVGGFLYNLAADWEENVAAFEESYNAAMQQ